MNLLYFLSAVQKQHQRGPTGSMPESILRIEVFIFLGLDKLKCIIYTYLGSINICNFVNMICVVDCGFAYDFT